jgi:tetratricopeptide (TPR) repeat protein
MRAFGQELQAVFGDRRVAEVAALLGRFLGLEMSESPLGQALSTRPDQEIDLGRAVLCRFLEEDAAAQPLVVILDDLDRADERSLDVLERLAAELGSAAIVLVVAGGPDLLVRRPGWGRGDGSHSRVDLGPLSPLEMDVFVRSVLGTQALAPGLAERAAAESGGNPFLLEQLLRLYEQHGVLVAETAETWSFDVARADRAAPELDPEATSDARLASLSPAERDVLARAGAFGTVFWTGGVVALGRLGAEPPDATDVFAPDPAIEAVAATLERLAEQELVVAMPTSGLPGEVEWSFCRPEDRERVLAGLDPALLARRRVFCAQWLEARSRRRPSSERLERVADLYEEGGDNRRAAGFLVAAGDTAMRRLRHERARSLYLRATRLFEIDDAVAKMDAFHKLGDVAVRLGRAREALGHFHEMLRLAWRLDLPAKGGAAHARVGRLYRALGELDRAERHLDVAHLLFDLSGDRPGIAATLDDIGRVHLLKGNFEEAAAFHRAALGIREELGDTRGKALTLSWMGLVELQRGNLPAAEACFLSALELGRAARDGHSIVFSLLDLGRLEREAGRFVEARRHLDEARALAREMGERLYECHIGLQIGDLRLAEGRPDVAEGEFRWVKDTAQRFGARRLVAEARRGIAEARLALGDSIGARDQAYEALSLAESMGVPPLEGAALRVLATAVASGAPGDADHGGPREMFDRAVELLAGVGAELELGRALAAYADFEEQTGRSSAATELREQVASIRERALGDAHV